MSMEEYHIEEELAKERIRKRNPKHPILLKFFPSTYEAVEAYWEAEKRMDKIIEGDEE